jgi:hypothetical protein
MAVSASRPRPPNAALTAAGVVAIATAMFSVIGTIVAGSRPAILAVAVAMAIGSVFGAIGLWRRQRWGLLVIAAVVLVGVLLNMLLAGTLSPLALAPVLALLLALYGRDNLR